MYMYITPWIAFNYACKYRPWRPFHWGRSCCLRRWGKCSELWPTTFRWCEWDSQGSGARESPLESSSCEDLVPSRCHRAPATPTRPCRCVQERQPAICTKSAEILVLNKLIVCALFLVFSWMCTWLRNMAVKEIPYMTGTADMPRFFQRFSLWREKIYKIF